MRFDDYVKTLKESEGYVEAMGPDFDEGIALIKNAWDEWKNGEMTEKSDIKPAQKDILNYMKTILK